MEIIAVVIILWLSWLTVLTGIEIKSLQSTVKKQQEQIDELYQQNNRLSELTVYMNQVSVDIANKVIRIEEKVDSDSERIKTLEMETRVINYKNSITS